MHFSSMCMNTLPYVYEYFACTCVRTPHTCLLSASEVRRGSLGPGTEVTDDHEPELNSDLCKGESSE